MTTFDLDDPLGDLLSEGSNDSFFEEPKVLAKKASLTKTPEKKALSDLFGLSSKEEPKEARNKEDDWLGLSDDGLTAKETFEKPTQRGKPVKKISFDDEDDNDIFSSLGMDKKTPVDSQKGGRGETKKASLMESILGTSSTKQNEEKPVSSFEDILKESKAKNVESSTQKTSISKQDTVGSKQDSIGTKLDLIGSKQEPLSSKEPVRYGFASLDAPREGRRGGRSQGALMDPLGLFSSETKKPDMQSSPTRRRDTLPSKTPPERLEQSVKEPERGDGDLKSVKTEVLYNADKDLKTKSAPNLTNLPDWLGGQGTPIRTHKSEAGINNLGVTPMESSTAMGGDSQTDFKSEPISFAPLTDSTSNQMLETLVAQQKMATTHLGYQNTSLALQQQESQLVMALQMRKYEENLADMQRQQHDVLVKQEIQFNSLLERQFAKQQVMENNMRLQQERINAHIQMLLSQPPVAGVSSTEDVSKASELRKTNSEEIIGLYEQMIASLKQHQHEELFLLEESYKKQITTLEATSEAVELRLKEEIDGLSGKHREKLELLRQEREEEATKYKEHIEELNEQHKIEMKRIRDNQSTIIDEIKYEYATLLENMKQTKSSESVLFENTSSYTQKLDVSLKMLDVNSKALFDLREKVDDDYSVLNKAREESIKAKEQEIKLMKQALEKAREIVETERSQLMGLVRTLETKLAEQSQNGREERWALQQATATLTAKATALDREVEYTRASLEQERSQIKTLKENLLAGQERQMLQLTEEKLAVSAEKSRLETLSKLQNNYDSKRARVEIEAAVQAAQAATDETYREREMLHQQQMDLENFRRQLEDKERKLYVREHNLDSLVKTAERKGNEGAKAFTEAKNLENMYSSQLKDIQRQLTSLTVREKKLAEEKISLSKERIALHNAARLSKKCSLCSIDVPSKLSDDVNNFDENFEPHLPQFINITDPELLRLRFEIENDNQMSPKNNLQDM